MHDLTKLIHQWKNSALELREAETLINLLIVDNKRLELDMGLLQVAFEDKKSLLESCEAALTERDATHAEEVAGLSGWGDEANKQHARAEKLRAVVIEADEYLETNELTSIGHGSILHKKLKALVDA